MSMVSLGDLAQNFILRRHMFATQSALNDRLAELGSGEVADKSDHLIGDFSVLAGIERSLTLTSSFASVITSAKTFFAGQSLALDRATGELHQTGMAFIEAAEGVDSTRRRAVAAEARHQFDMVLAALNTQIGGRSLFAGVSTQSAAFAASQDILSALATHLSTESTATDVLTAIDGWFASGGSYETLTYLGHGDDLGGFRVAEAVTIAPDLSGTDGELRELVKNYALGALIADGSLPLIEAEQVNLMRSVGAAMINLDRDLIETRAELGAVESRLDRIDAENKAESFALMAARQDLIGVDTAETAMRLTELETQLEALYAVTARVSQLSLTGYLR